jgi:pyridoxamine 5'-phosphate oxidase
MKLSAERIAELRREYTARGLRRTDLDPDPFKQFGRWIDEALEAELTDANCMTLATAAPGGSTSARMVLLKGFDERGFVFFTNYESAKGRQLAANPNAALVFYWAELERQICIEGVASKVSREESDAYFKSRPRGSQLGAWASAQSEVVASREVLEQELARLTEKYRDAEIPLPPNWGGYRVRPETIEFWQGRPNRLHDRLRYVRQSGGAWKIERLAP